MESTGVWKIRAESKSHQPAWTSYATLGEIIVTNTYCPLTVTLIGVGLSEFSVRKQQRLILRIYTEVCETAHGIKSLRIRFRASLVAQWLGICLPVQGTWVQALFREDSTCPGATKPGCLNYWACALELASHNYWAHEPQLLQPAHLEPCSTAREARTMRSPHTATKSSPRSPQLEKARAQQ